MNYKITTTKKAEEGKYNVYVQFICNDGNINEVFTVKSNDERRAKDDVCGYICKYPINRKEDYQKYSNHIKELVEDKNGARFKETINESKVKAAISNALRSENGTGKISDRETIKVSKNCGEYKIVLEKDGIEVMKTVSGEYKDYEVIEGTFIKGAIQKTMMS